MRMRERLFVYKNVYRHFITLQNIKRFMNYIKVDTTAL